MTTIYVSGLPPFDPATGTVIEAPIERQTSISLRKLAYRTSARPSSLRKRLSGNPADGQFVVPAQAGTQGQATEIPGFPLSRERRAKGAKVGYAELDYSFASGDPEPALGVNRGRALSRQLLVKITPLPIMALDQLQFPRAAPFLDALFAEERSGHGLVKLDNTNLCTP
jgi:hypothetical protein